MLFFQNELAVGLETRILYEFYIIVKPHQNQQFSHLRNVKVAPKARLRAQIFIKFCILVTDTLKINPVKFFDSAPTLKIDPFPYKGITPYMERLNGSDSYYASG